MEIQVDVDEADVGKVREGQKATFTVDAYPDRKFRADDPPAPLRLGDRVGRRHLQGRAHDRQLRAAAAAGHDGDRGDHGRSTSTTRCSSPTRRCASRRRATPTAPTSGGLLSKLLPGPPPFRPASSKQESGPNRTVWVLRDGAPAAVGRGRRRHRRQAHRDRQGRPEARRPGHCRYDPTRPSGERPCGQSQASTRRLIELRSVTKVYGVGRGRGARAARASTSEIERRRVRRDHGAVGLRQVDGDEHPRLPRHADARRLPVSRAREVGHLDRTTSARCCAATSSASSSRASICCRAPPRWRTSSCR